MGYLHSWNGYYEITPQLIEDVKRIIETSGVTITGPDGTGEPILLVEDRIEFNGSAEHGQDYEPIRFAQFGLDGGGSAKTDKRPYDKVACAVLLRIHELNPKFHVFSDGGFLDKWSRGTALYVDTFGEEPSKPADMRSFEDEDELDEAYGIDDYDDEDDDDDDDDDEGYEEYDFDENEEEGEDDYKGRYEVDDSVISLIEEALRDSLKNDDAGEVDVTYADEKDFNDAYDTLPEEEEEEEDEEGEWVPPTEEEMAKVRDQYERMLKLYQGVTALGEMDDPTELVPGVPENWHPRFSIYLNTAATTVPEIQAALVDAKEIWAQEPPIEDDEDDYDGEDEGLVDGEEYVTEDDEPVAEAEAESVPELDDFDKRYSLFQALAWLNGVGDPTELVKIFPVNRREKFETDLGNAAVNLKRVQAAYND